MKATADTRYTDPKDRAIALRAAVLKLLRWLPEHYSLTQYKQGIAYLEAYVKDDYYAGEISKSKRFWAWWRNHWADRDEEFLTNVYELNISLKQVEALYNDMNDGEGLTKTLRPHRVVLEDSFKEMISQVTKEQVCEQN